MDFNTTDTVFLTLTSGDSNGTLTGATWVSAGRYQLSGLPATLTTALEAVVFTPTAYEVPPGNTVTTGITIIASQTAGGSTASVTNAVTTIVATARNDAASLSVPTLTGGNSNITIANNATIAPFSGVTISDPVSGASETLVITVTTMGTVGGLVDSATDAYVSLSGAEQITAGTYTISGTPSAASSALDALLFTSDLPVNSAATTLLTVTDTNNAGASDSLSLSVFGTVSPGVLTISGATAVHIIIDTATILPFIGITITDPNGINQSDTVTVTSSAPADGIFRDASGNTVGADGVYTVIGSAADVSAALQALTFTPYANEVGSGFSLVDAFTIAVSDTAGQTASQNASSVIIIGVETAQAVSGVGAGIGAGAASGTDYQSLSVFSNISTIASTTNSSKADIETASANVGTKNGVLSDPYGTISSDGQSFYISGDAAEVAAAIAALSFTPTKGEAEPGTTITTSVTLALDDGIALTTQVTNLYVVESFTPFVDLSVSTDDPDAVKTLSVALSANLAGTFSNLGIGTLSADGATYIATGTESELNAALQGLVFTPTDQTSDLTPEVSAVISGVALTSSAPQAILTAGATASTVYGGSGQVTISARAGGGLFFGGSAGDNQISATAASSTLVGGGDGDVLTAASSGGDMMVAVSGAETLDGSKATGSDVFFSNATGGSAILTGLGRDTVVIASGSNTISGTAGIGSIIFVGSSASSSSVARGSNTINAAIGGVQDRAGITTFIGGAMTVVGVSSSITVDGGSGGGCFFGASSGGNQLTSGTGAVTMVGGGTGDLLTLSNDLDDMLVAGSGNETLSAAYASGSVVVFGGSGDDLVTLGSGSDIFVSGRGAASVVAGNGADQFDFSEGNAGSTTISGFTAGRDVLNLFNYTQGAGAATLQSQSVAAGNTTLSLSDGTMITLIGVSGLTSKAFG